MKSINLIILSSAIVICGNCIPALSQINMASAGKSTFTIVVPADAPNSVTNSERELQRDIQESTGVLLPVEKDTASIHSPFISLGNTRQFKAAKIATDDIREEGFCIISQSNSLYIWGMDTPDGKWTTEGGTSNGTANGVYTFLEDFLDVRWLMPGELGRAVPPRSTFVVPIVNRIENPLFISRRLPYLVASRTFVNDSSTVHQWEDRASCVGLL